VGVMLALHEIDDVPPELEQLWSKAVTPENCITVVSKEAEPTDPVAVTVMTYEADVAAWIFVAYQPVTHWKA
jgi:hypothetical protein